ncbi:type II secretion system protein [Bacteroidota bacterium]
MLEMILKDIYKFLKPLGLARTELGFAMIEIVVALAIIGLAGVSFLAALTTVSKSTVIAEECSVAQSLAVSQMEYAISQSYDDTGSPPQYTALSDTPDGWSVSVSATRLDPENDGTGDDDGIQEVTVLVNLYSQQVAELTSRKVNFNYVP